MRKRQAGQLLIESLVAITVIAIAILGVFRLSSRSISLNRVVSDQYTATYLAAEGIEVVKNIIDTNVVYDCEGWNIGVNVEGNYTVDYTKDDGNALVPVTGFGAAPVQFKDGVFGVFPASDADADDTRFVRVITLEGGDTNDSLHVISKVEWKGRGNAEFEVVLEDVFYNWRPFADNCSAGA